MRTLFGPGDSSETPVTGGLVVHVLHADHGIVHMPSREIMLQSMYSRAGSDLVLTSPEQGKFIVKGFFLSDPPPSLSDGDVTHIPGELVRPVLKLKAEAFRER